ncbi:MAG: TetR family transcriptional regulator [Alphaproteobacteria bacterium]|nr:TetR family transcriptional regulator [Alphaproteobacteria bacterium]
MELEEKPIKAVKRDPKGVRRNILRVSSKEFAEYGLSGARVNEIAALTKASKRMIYYYYGDKEGLYKACLEAAYSHVRAGEEKLDLGGLEPDKALAKLVGFTFDHHRKNPDFIRLVMIENIHKAAFLKGSEIIRSVNAAAIKNLTDIIIRGQSSGVFRDKLDPVELHWQISALSFFNVSNKPTFSALFDSELYSDEGQRTLRDHAVEMILLYVSHKQGTQK